MFTLPENCTADQALACCIAYEESEKARCLAEYEPYEDGAGEPAYEPSDEDREWLAPLGIAGEVEAWADYREWAEATESGLTDLDILAATGCVG